jgi:hypothetical protein
MQSWLLWWGVLSGCARQLDDHASVCVGPDSQGAPDDPVVVLEADLPVTFAARAFGGCHMADFRVECEALLDRDTIVVSTWTSWVRTEPLALACESILLIAESSCATPPLAAGSYTVRYADQELGLVVPGTQTGACITPSRD